MTPIYEGDPNEVVELAPGLSVRRAVTQAIRLLHNGVPEVGIPFIARMIDQLGSADEMARFLDTADEVGVSPAECILRGSQTAANKMLDEHLQANPQHHPV